MKFVSHTALLRANPNLVIKILIFVTTQVKMPGLSFSLIEVSLLPCLRSIYMFARIKTIIFLILHHEGLMFSFRIDCLTYFLIQFKNTFQAMTNLFNLEKFQLCNFLL